MSPRISASTASTASSTLVGVVVVGHGRTATTVLAAARAIIGDGRLDDVIAVDAGEGETPRLNAEMCAVMARADRGRGVLLLVDLLGASPCQCGQREGLAHDLTVLSGLSLAMLLKLSTLDRAQLDGPALATACEDSARRAMVTTHRSACASAPAPALAADGTHG